MNYPHTSTCLCNACIDARPPLPEGPALSVRASTVGSLPPPHDGKGYTLHTPKDAANPKDTLGAAKPSMGLIPVGAMEQIARVMELGAKKYGPYNWRSKAVKKMVYANAALRHLFKWIGGESYDAEASELAGQPISHMACVAACMMIVLDAEAHGKAIDDREWVK